MLFPNVSPDSSHPHIIKSTNKQVHIQELGKERKNNPQSPWEQMSPAQTSDRLPQPTARLKVLCTAEGGHYCWPFCTGGNIGGSEEAAGLNKALTHFALLTFSPFAKIQQVTFEPKPLTRFFCNLQQINRVPFSY